MFLGLEWYTYDFEVFSHDWMVDFKPFGGEHLTIINSTEELREFMANEKDAVFCGFNTKHYDQFIMKALMNNASADEVKSLNDFIISGNAGWDHRLMEDNPRWFNNVDITDDMQDGQSLKSIEGHLYMDIEETEVDFNLDRPLTAEELEKTQHYCRHDVDATEMIVKLREPYLRTKISIGAIANIPPEKALSYTNARLTAAFLHAEMKPWSDEREYKYPDNLDRRYIPKEVFDFFDRIHDPSISDEKLWKSHLDIMVGGTMTRLGFGGIHSAIPNYIWREGENND